MFDALHRADEMPAGELRSLPENIVQKGTPMVLRGAVKDWPIVLAAVRSDEAAAEYINSFYNGKPVSTIVAPASERGRFFYRADSKQMNFEGLSANLTNVLNGILKQRQSAKPLGVAVQALTAAEFLPGLEQENPNPLVPEGTRARLWIGNRVTVAPHFDVAENLAYVVAGRRRFILFPPEQTANLYPGPMDVTPANVPISMVSLEEPELDRFPRFREALSEAIVCELEPGDAVYIPYLWWHGVQSLAGFNVLANYWFNRDESLARHPYVALLNFAFVLFEQMPEQHRKAWRALYDHYVFQFAGNPMKALAPSHRDSGRTIDPSDLQKFKEVLHALLSNTVDGNGDDSQLTDENASQ